MPDNYAAIKKTKVSTISAGTALFHILKEKGFGEYALKCDHEV